MKRVITAANKPNKSQLRSEFVQLATEIREMSKNEFVQLLKNNEFETAQKWIDTLKDIRNTFENDAHTAIEYYAARVVVDGKFVGYVRSARKKSGSRMWDGRVDVRVTDDITNAQMFASPSEAKHALTKGNDIGVYLDNNVGYRYEPSYSVNHAGELHETASSVNHMDIFYAANIHFELEQI